MRITNVKGKIIKFWKLPGRYQKIVIEAVFLMGAARFSILVFPFKKVASVMGKPMTETSENIDARLLNTARQVAWFVRKLADFTPWESKCLVQALTAQMMLKRRKIPSTLYLGIAKDNNKKLIAHAWLRCGSSILTGDYERPSFSTVAWFAVNIPS